MKEKIILALVVVLVGFAVANYFKEPAKITVVSEDGKTQVVDSVGAFPGPDIYETLWLHEGVTTGGSASYSNSSTTQTAITLTTAEIDRDISYLEYNTGTSTTVTTMSSSSAPFADLRVGDGFSIDFYYATTTDTSTVTFAAGTGVDLQEDEGETVIVNGLEMARLNFRKKADTNILMWVEAGQVGD